MKKLEICLEVGKVIRSLEFKWWPDPPTSWYWNRRKFKILRREIDFLSIRLGPVLIMYTISIQTDNYT